MKVTLHTVASSLSIPKDSQPAFDKLLLKLGKGSPGSKGTEHYGIMNLLKQRKYTLPINGKTGEGADLVKLLKSEGVKVKLT